MRVGVYCGGKTPELGGAYTLENQMLNAVARYGLDRGHTFVLLSECNFNNLSLTDLKGFELYQIKISFVNKLILLTLSVVDRLLILIGFLGLNKIKQNLKSKIIERGTLKSCVDYIISFNQTVPSKEIPYLVTLWDLEHRTKPFFPEVSEHGIWRNREDRFSEVLGRAAAIVTGTEVGKAQIEKFYNIPEETVRVLPFPEPEFPGRQLDTHSVLSKYELPDNYLFYPAQFWPHKNHICLIEAIHLLSKDKGLLVNLVFVGNDKGNQRYVEELVKNFGLTEQIFFLGFVSREELAALYKKAFALTYVTFFGPDNVPPLEAFSLGCPVIASKVSGAQEQLQDAAILVNPKDPNDIATAIWELYKNPLLREKLISKGYVQASRFNASDYVDQIISILDEFKGYRRCWPSGGKGSTKG